MKKIRLMHILFLILGMIITACGSGGGSGDRSGEGEFTVRKSSSATITTVRVSVDSDGNQSTTNASSAAAISSDGRYVVFESSASDLVAGDTNGLSDIFVHDRTTNATTRVSVDSAGNQTQFNGSKAADISSDGRYVVFESIGGDLVAGDTNGLSDIFVHDRTTNATTRVSVDSAGNQTQFNGSKAADISSDGRYVVFESSASDLVAGDTNGLSDIFVHDRTTNATTRVSVDSAGNQTQFNGSKAADISSDGRYVVFESIGGDLVAGDTNGLSDIFVHDRTTNATTRVSVASGGVEAKTGASFAPSISSDGRYVVFESIASDLVAGDTNGLSDIFVHDRTTNATTRVSVASGGVEAKTGASFAPSISSDGRYVVFESIASDLVAGDTNGLSDIFVHNRTTNATTRVSLDFAGNQTQFNGSKAADISSDGRYVVFESIGGDLVAGDTNGLADIFVHDRDADNDGIFDESTP